MSKCKGTSRVALLLVSSLLFIQTIPLVTPDSITDIDGQGSVEIIFPGPGTRFVNLTVPEPFQGISGKLQLRGDPLAEGNDLFPQNVAIDIGDDDGIEWAFSGTGYGPLGQQDGLDDGSTTKDIDIGGPTQQNVEILLPRGATIDDAGLTISGLNSPTGTVSSTEKNQSLAGLSSDDHMINGIKSHQIAADADVRLGQVVGIHQAWDIDQNQHSALQYMDIGDYPAQSFVVNRTDPKQEKALVHAIGVYVSHNNPTDQGLELRVYNASASNNYQPTGSLIANKTIWMPNIPDGGYLNFTFDPPMVLEPDKVYIFTMNERFQTALFGHFSVGYHQGPGPNNANTNYPTPGCWMQLSNDYGQNWNTFKNRDFSFKTYVSMARTLSNAELQYLKVDGASYDDINGRDLSFNVTTPRYDDNGWNFTLRNDLPISVLFDLDASIDHYDLPNSISLDVGDDGDIEYSQVPDLLGFKTITALGPSFTKALEKATQPGTTDQYGNLMMPVPVNLTADGNGTIRVENLFVNYSYVVTIPKVLKSIEGYRDLHGDGVSDLTVPIKVSTSSPGSLNLSGFEFVYDGPPRIKLPYPVGLSILEEEASDHLLQMNTLFLDDYTDPLDCTVLNYTTVGPWKPDLKVEIISGQLSIDATEAINWTGVISVNIKAVDDLGRYVIAGPVNVTVENVNDAPFLEPLPNEILGNATEPLVIHLDIIDCDSEDLAIVLEGAPNGMVFSDSTNSLHWTPPNDSPRLWDITIKVTDGEFTMARHLRVIIKGVLDLNGPPVFTDISIPEAYVGQPLVITFNAIDPDDDDLRFNLENAPSGMVLNPDNTITFTPESAKEFIFNLTVSDGFVTVREQRQFKVSECNIDLRIITPQRDSKIERTLSLSGTVASACIGPYGVWYKIDEGEWKEAGVNNQGSWFAEPSIDSLKKGTHTIVVKVQDDQGNTLEQNYTTIDLVRTASNHSSSGIGYLQTLSYLLVLIIIMAVLAGIALKKRKGSARARGTNKSRSKFVKDLAPKAADGSTPSIENAFLVYYDGRLITYSSHQEIKDLDGTLQVIKGFVRSSFKGEMGKLDSLRYENMNVLLERGTQMYLVVMTHDDEVTLLRRSMRRFLHVVHSQNKKLLKVWDGKYESVAGISAMVEAFVNNEWVPPSDENGPSDPGYSSGKREKKDLGVKAVRWDDSPDIDHKDVSNIEKLRLLEDRFVRGELTEKEFERLSKRLK